MPVKPYLSQIPNTIAAVSDYKAFARERLDDNAWAYLHSGAADEITFRNNRLAFDQCALLNRVLADVRGGHTRLELFGQTLQHPILLAPVAYQQLFHPEGELAAVRAAAAMDAVMVVSTLASHTLEDIAHHAYAPLWFQLYFQQDRVFSSSLVRRAEAAGYRALVVTVDAPLAGVRNREQRAGFHLPDGIAAVNLRGMQQSPVTLAQGQSVVFDGLMAHAPTWRDIERLRQLTDLPLLLKGITHPADAQLAMQLGVNGLIVSNHGGRTLDTVPAILHVLPGIVAAVQGQLPVLLDGGVRRGTDIVKALALGASAVLIGRPMIYGMATAGALGVAHVLRLLWEEMEVAMALSGCRTLSDITPNILAINNT
ncbi:MAG: alpha-hydroxy-acid oxidizing protein [Candidatus Thiothrix moscowensis]|nr:alpha-hydroxy-acid oxidizing protein [Candidatus Thiothrix moscowensis]